MTDINWKWTPSINSWETDERNGVVVRVEVVSDLQNAKASIQPSKFLLVYAYTTNDVAAERFQELRRDESKKLIPVTNVGEAMRIGTELAQKYQHEVSS